MDYFIGWDVGGWTCDRNAGSRDAICVLKSKERDLAVEGKIARGTLRDAINGHDSLHTIVNQFCETSLQAEDRLFLAVDTPLGFSAAFRRLVSEHAFVDVVPEESIRNPYVYRRTEGWLFQRGFKPLSAVKDMIGSQSTKGIHLLAKLGLKSSPDHPGVWRSETGRVVAFEAYPTPCKTSPHTVSLVESLRLNQTHHADQVDAAYCAIVAYLFATEPGRLMEPCEGVDHLEGWIWIPRDAVPKRAILRG